MTERLLQRCCIGLRGLLFATALALLAPIAGAQDDADVEVKGATIGRMGEPIGVDPDTFEFTDAELKLWMDNHLQNIESPGRLFYQFVKRGSLEEDFSDAVYLDILGINDDGSKEADLQFFTADRRQLVSPDNLSRITGNPVLLVYMQGDVYEMNRLTSGSWRYFQRRIKAAFADGAAIEPVVFEYGDEQLEGEKITIRPFLDDPRQAQLASFSAKLYEFIISDQVPGKLYQIKTVVPSEDAAQEEPLIEETLTLQYAEFKD